MTPSIAPSIFKRSGGIHEVLDIKEVYNLWSLLVTRYSNIEVAQVLKNLIHDRDLALLVDDVLDGLTRQSEMLEKEAITAQMKLPRRPPTNVRFSPRLDEITDEFIYTRIFLMAKEDLFTTVQAVRSSITNEGIRKMIRGILKQQLSKFELLVKYGKLKGWLEVVPAYKTTALDPNGRLGITSAYHLWFHIVLRYYQLELNQFFLGLAHDSDFLALLRMGVETLRRQIEDIEQRMLSFEIPLPNRPAASVPTPVNMETLEDRHMFQTIFRGIYEAVDQHLRAVVEITFNDSLRLFFTDLLNDEMDMWDKVLKFGKMKAWLIAPPPYTAT